MTVDDFTSTSIALLRSAVGWQSAIARRLNVDSRQVRRWLAQAKIPPWVDAALGELIGATDMAPWPRDEWLIGSARGADGKHREYIMHLQPPRFVTRVVVADDDGVVPPDEQPVDILSGIVYAADESTVLCEIDWIEPVAPGEHVKWLEAAADAMEDWMDD